MSAVRKVFVDGFAAARGASDVLVPKLPLGELFGRRLHAAIESLGVTVITGQGARRVVKRKEGVAVETHDGVRYETDHVVSAVPWHSVAGLLSPKELPDVDRFAQFPVSRITGLHLWFDREFTDRPHAVMVGTVSQWLFRQPWESCSSGSECYYQVVISASQRAQAVAREQLAQTVLDELRIAFPAAKDATLLRCRIVSDPNSVFSVRPEVEAIRPTARTALPWLHLAGDWTATGWPATMEGAVISGRLAASSIVEQESMAPVEVDSGLNRGWLARQILGP
jgi:monoamine oxidase